MDSHHRSPAYETGEDDWTPLLCDKFGAPRQNRTAIHGLQNRYTSIVLVGRIVFQRPPILVEGTQWFVSYGGGLAFSREKSDQSALLATRLLRLSEIWCPGEESNLRLIFTKDLVYH